MYTLYTLITHKQRRRKKFIREIIKLHHVHVTNFFCYTYNTTHFLLPSTQNSLPPFAAASSDGVNVAYGIVELEGVEKGRFRLMQTLTMLTSPFLGHCEIMQGFCSTHFILHSIKSHR